MYHRVINTFLVSKKPCYLGIFAQLNHSKHVDETFYLIGQHLTKYKEFTINDQLMDKFYPNAVRNFIRGNAPTDGKPQTII